MDIFDTEKIEGLILKKLIRGELSTITLLSKIRLDRDITKQGFYAALRKLKKNDVILMYKKNVSLNIVWIKKMRDVLEDVSRAYITDQKSFDVLDLGDKESISYSFSTIKNLDTFWGHSQNTLMYNTSPNQPIYSYDPHYWFYLVRRETEKHLLEEIVKNKRQFLMTVGNRTPLDKIVKTDFNNDYLQYNYKNLFEKNNYYITVIGDYVIEVTLDEKTSDRIDSLYNSTKNHDEVISELHTILEAKVKNKIKIARNKLKAQKLKTKLGKDFYILRS